MVHGVFDIVHIGHIKYFQEARSLVDYLIVSVTSDKYIKKGPGKPIFDINKRCEVLKSIKYIDEVIISDFETAKEIINIVKPNIYIKGNDYKNFRDDLSKNIILEKKKLKNTVVKLYLLNPNCIHLVQ